MKKYYTVHDSYGRILRTGMQSSCYPFCYEDEFVIEGRSDPKTQMVKDGKIVAGQVKNAPPEKRRFATSTQYLKVKHPINRTQELQQLKDEAQLLRERLERLEVEQDKKQS